MDNERQQRRAHEICKNQKDLNEHTAKRNVASKKLIGTAIFIKTDSKECTQILDRQKNAQYTFEN